MNSNLTLPRTSALLFALVLCGSAVFCKKTPTASSAPPFAQLTELLAAADTLSAEQLGGHLAKAATSLQDSFFHAWFDRLQEQDRQAEVKQYLDLLKSLRPGLMADTYEALFQGVWAQYRGRFDSAETQYALAATKCEQLADPLLMARIWNASSGNLATQAKYDVAIAQKLRAVSLFDSLGQTKQKWNAQAQLANIHNLKGDFDRALQLLEEPIKYALEQRDSLFLAYAYSTVGSAHGGKKDYKMAISYHQKVLAIRQSPKHGAQKAESLYHVGWFLSKLGQCQAALDTFYSAMREIEAGENKQGLGHVQLGIGEALFHLGSLEKAQTFLEKALETSLKRKQYPPAQMAAQMLSECHKKRGDFKEALRLKELQMALKDSVFNRERMKISQEISVKYETREKEIKIQALQREKALTEQRTWGMMGLLLLLSILAFNAYRLRVSEEKQRIMEMSAQARSQAVSLNNQLEKSTVELKTKEKKLEEYARMLMERNEQINALSLRMEMSLLAPKSDQTANPYDLYNQAILTEDDWEQFQHHFNSAYPGYISALRTKHPGLTPAEIRLVLFDKMGLSLKEASAILGVSIDAVKKGRYRLKKKYHIEGENLAEGL